MSKEIYAQAVNTARALAIEAIQEANSGHPGLPLGAAPMVFELYYNHMAHNPSQPEWFNRDRFILSAGHGSALLYSILHLFGYEISTSDLKSFRQLGSKTPGHPEYGDTPGVETTTGPLGQGFANAVGMALAEVHLAAKYNRPNFPIINHYTYVLAGDGDLMEGISSEASSLAGHLGLGKLIVLYDDNQITIDGSTDITFTEQVKERYEAYGWQVIEVKDGENTAAIGQAIELAKKDADRPTLIRVRTIIGNFSPVAGKAKAHGAPLGIEGVKSTLRNLSLPADRQPFAVDNKVRELLGNKQEALRREQERWNDLYEAWQSNYPQLAEELESCLSGKLPADLVSEDFFAWQDSVATRSHSSKILNYLNEKLPNLIGGSADLAGSNNAFLQDGGVFQKDTPLGKNIHFGIREFGMAAIANGIMLHGGLRPFAATFFTFVDYMKAAVRLSALMSLPVLYLLTHDSIGVGEDGPTHEPIEQLASLRAMPNINTFRPADGVEVAAGYLLWLQSQKPMALILSRQSTPYINSKPQGALKGGYILKDADSFELILIASGSEVALALEASELLEQEGIFSRVVSMPCQNLFDEQDQKYKDEVLPPTCRSRVAVEAGASYGWERYVGLDGAIVGMNSFGASGPGSELFRHFGFTPEAVVATAKEVLAKKL